MNQTKPCYQNPMGCYPIEVYISNEEWTRTHPSPPMVEFTEDEWNSVYTGYIQESSFYSHKIRSEIYGTFWIPKCFVR